MSARRSRTRRLIRTAILGILASMLVVLFFAYGPVLIWMPMAIGMGQWGSGGPSSTKTVRGAYYHISVRYLVDKVEPLDFDVVVACGEHRLETPGSKRGTVPSVYARRTADNHAVLIGVPEVCLIAKSRSLGQRDGIFDGSFVPFTIWFDDADNLETGLGYGSIYAYGNATARLTFLEGKIRYATREEFADWFANDNDNLLTSAMLESLPYDRHGWLREEAAAVPRACYGLRLTETNEAGQSLLKTYWPADRPEFWSEVLLPKEPRLKLEFGLATTQDVKFGAYGSSKTDHMRNYRAQDWSSDGAYKGYSSLNRSKLSSYLNFEFLPTEHYPVYYNNALSVLRAGNGTPFLAADIDLRPESKGFVACYTRYPRGMGAVTEHPEALKHYFGIASRPDVFKIYVNGAPQFETTGSPIITRFILQSDKGVGELSVFFSKRGDRVE
ncbi:hypothetical protein GFK91_29680 (plasmid) [Roseibium aggregatum]|uniref:hypothetical protein n=1 Tax=Roseibium aggregatum TaxID=187304 RepID=UPI001E43CAA1|nr:hypothetical protein [Roseibium aggregatum]UES59921.1 hypothetical protein GFK91_29680 [Roseibium aggregatum]